MQLAGLGWGDPKAQPVLALHGWLDNAASFVPVAKFLKDYRLIALDFPGHGFSDHRPPGYHYHFIDYIADVLNAANALGWDRFHLLGHSLGGAVATCVAAVATERVSQLALIESTGPWVSEANDAPKRWQDASEQMARVSRRRVPVYTDLDAILRARRLASPMSEAAARLIIERSMKSEADEWTWRSDVRLRVSSPMYLTEEHVRAYLREICAPTLLIRGLDSEFIARKFLVDRQELFNDLTVVDLPGRHHLHMDTPAPVAQRLRQFLSSFVDADGSDV